MSLRYIFRVLQIVSVQIFFKRLFENLKQIHVESIDNHPVVLSLGACFFDGKEDLSFDELYCRADSAMYESKNRRI